MTLEQDDTVFPEEEDLDDEDSQDDDDDEEEELLNDDVSLSDDVNSPSTSSSHLLHRHTVTPLSNPNPNATTTTANSSSAVVTVAVPAPSDHLLPPPSASVAVNTTSTSPAVAAVNPLPELQRKPQIDDSRKLFQRLWTDEDEIELLRGFLEYTTARGGVTGSSGGGAHHHDTALFYDQIKSKLQLDFNKSQLVEKLRRLKKKYRNVIAKISSGKEFAFKSPHDQTTFEISRKIWSNIGAQSVNHDAIDDDDDQNHSNNHNNYSIVRIGNPSLNCSNPNLITNPTMEARGDDFNRLTPNKSRKRPRPQTTIQTQPVKVEDKNIGVVGNDGCAVNVVGSNNLNSSGGGGGGVGGGGPGGNITGVIEETVRSCLSPVFKELLNGVNGVAAGGGARGFGGGIAAAMSPLSFGFGGFGLPSPVMGFGIGSNGGEGTDERWRKQQILELEVYLKRVELVQDQIKAMLEELRSTGG